MVLIPALVFNILTNDLRCRPGRKAAGITEALVPWQSRRALVQDSTAGYLVGLSNYSKHFVQTASFGAW